jgi:hypothetical protein
MIKFDVNDLPQAMFFIKGLPLNPVYMEEMQPDLSLEDIYTDCFTLEDMEIIFNKFNIQTLFTMGIFTSEVF